MSRAQYVFIILLLVAGLTACDKPPQGDLKTSARLTSPPLSQTYQRNLRPRTRESLQLLKTYPVPVFLTQIEVKAEPESALEGLDISFSEPERHFRKLGFRNACPYLLRQEESFGETFPTGQGLPLRSNEVLYLDATWQMPANSVGSVTATCEVILHFRVGTELKALKVEPIGDDKLRYSPENQTLTWPEPLR